MKNLTQSIMAITAMTFLVACGGSEKKAEEKTNEETPKEQKVEVKEINVIPNESKVAWEGTVLGVYSHSGTVDVTEGMLKTEGDQIIEGNFVVDLTSMTATDENYTPEEGKTKEKLIGHLSSPDFFMVDSFPKAMFYIKSHDLENKTITGDLVIRGNKNEEQVTAVYVDLESGTAGGTLTFDRTKYDVAFSHPAEDIVISDEVELEIMLKM